MKKPAHQWETRLHRAHRIEGGRRGRFADDARAERFELRFADGTVAGAHLGLAYQQVDRSALRDPDLEHAVACWLAARGGRELALHDEHGVELARRSFAPADLGDAAGGPAERLISLAPSCAELLHALGLDDRLIACEDSSDFPPRVAELERLGPDLGPDLDRVAALAPDRVLSSLTVPGMERNVTGLRARGVAQAVSAPRSVDDVVAELRVLGVALGAAEAGHRAAERLLAERAELRRALGPRPRRVYLEWWPRPMFTPGHDCYSNELIALAGGVNVFADRPGSSVEIDAAELVAAEPELCVVSWCGVAEDKLDPDNLRARPGLEGLKAAREGRVAALDECFSGRPGPRMLEASRRMAAMIRGLP